MLLLGAGGPTPSPRQCPTLFAILSYLFLSFFSLLPILYSLWELAFYSLGGRGSRSLTSSYLSPNSFSVLDKHRSVWRCDCEVWGRLLFCFFWFILV